MDDFDFDDIDLGAEKKECAREMLVDLFNQTNTLMSADAILAEHGEDAGYTELARRVTKRLNDRYNDLKSITPAWAEICRQLGGDDDIDGNSYLQNMRREVEIDQNTLKELEARRADVACLCETLGIRL
jgi:hypothetical protein